jgi:type IV secretory pathway TraG/TraD family ATPase VirD4
VTSRRPIRDPQGSALLLITVVVIVAVAAVNGAAWIAAWLSGTDEDWPGNPFALAFGLLTGRYTWPRDAWIAVVAVGCLLLAGVAAVAVVAARRRRGRTRVDYAAAHMATTQELRPLLDAVGPRIGRAVSGGGWLRRPRQWVTLQLWAPRMGKTSTQGIPAVLDAPGAVLATSNKRDLVDATREGRATRGGVWIFDPNGIAGEPPVFWWNPLSYVTDETKARQLAKTFTAAQREPGARTDAYFDPAGQTLLGNLLLAAACSGRLLPDVYAWLTRPTNRTPVEVLRGRGYPMQADAVEAIIDLHPKQRGGVYGTAEQTMSFLTSRAVQAWIMPPEGPFAVEFDPAAFVRSTDSLYLLSKEGEGSGGPIVTALTVAVVEAAIGYARCCPGGQLPIPMTVELDEAANICRWPDLPDLYSHFGSQHIEVATYLQSYAQGEAVWGREGMRKLWSAANLKIVGPGVSEVSLLADVSRLVGDYDPTRVSTGYGHAGRSVSYSTERRAILPVSELGSLPGPVRGGDFSRARMLVLAAGIPPALARPVPWWEGSHAATVRMSLARNDPGSAPARPVVAPRDVPPAGDMWRKRKR